MSHNLFLGMYTFGIKKLNTPDSKRIEINDFLSNAYPDDDNKFTKGFVQNLIYLIDEKTYKNERNTHGAILEEKSINSSRRILDILIDGGTTGIKQFIIDESGKKRILSDSEIVGPKFYARIWMPANTKTGYLFIQKYGSFSIKPIFDDIIKDVLKSKGYNIINNSIKATTTKARQKEFLKRSTIRDIVIVSNRSSHETGAADAASAEIRLKNIITQKNKVVGKTDMEAALKNHGFSIGRRDYDIKATYQNKIDDFKEERTIMLDSSEETINVIPNILIPQSCIDADNYPIFSKMQDFVDKEMIQVKKEAKI
ncbi:hypothetical protein [uncultured Sunxiuqinia sp.]|uniref:hypothetical protein n=1 Tax=uncultured Sunxiuqinia sp. TaxID=1573825 RepID=UPI002AA6C1CD|nr:hypothetical protein [uncultured Sunxiuqinia sp.]